MARIHRRVGLMLAGCVACALPGVTLADDEAPPRSHALQDFVSGARALLQGRFSPSIDDVAALAHPVLRHRIALTYGARAEGVTLTSIIDRLIGLLG